MDSKIIDLVFFFNVDFRLKISENKVLINKFFKLFEKVCSIIDAMCIYVKEKCEFLTKIRK